MLSLMCPLRSRTRNVSRVGTTLMPSSVCVQIDDTSLLTRSDTFHDSILTLSTFVGLVFLRACLLIFSARVIVLRSVSHIEPISIISHWVPCARGSPPATTSTDNVPGTHELIPHVFRGCTTTPKFLHFKRGLWNPGRCQPRRGSCTNPIFFSLTL